MLNSPADPEPAFSIRSLEELRRTASGAADWLWQGYLAPGSSTLLTSQWKKGKTTLLAMLLDRMKAGGELAGLPVKAGRAVVISEEVPSHWLTRGERFDLSGHVQWICRPFRGKPSSEQWQSLLDHLLAVHAQVGLSLVAIDSLSSFLPGRSENDAATMLAGLVPLQDLTAVGLSVLILHHPHKRWSPDGQAARGSGALSGWADVLMELDSVKGAGMEDRRRRLLAWSRHQETPRRLLIELSPDGRSYAVLPDEEEEPDEPLREVLWRVLEQAQTKLTCAEVLSAWPAECPRPSPVTMWRMLTRAVERGELRRDGAGVKADGFRYWLPSQEER